MGGALNGTARLGTAALVLALIANIPVIAALIIFAILFSVLGGNSSVFDAVAEFFATIGPIVPSILAGLSLLALALGVAANVRSPGQRDGVTAIVIVVAVPILAFVVFAALILF